MKNLSILNLQLCFALVVCFLLPAAESVAQEEKTAGELIKVLESSDASENEKAQACQDLGALGGDDAVPALARMLDDERFSHYARYGLQTNPSAAAGDALRDAIDQLSGDLLVGVINSVGARGDERATAQLAQLLESDDEKVAVSAAGALVKIGTERALNTLLDASSPFSNRLADPLLECADLLAEAGRNKEAEKLFDKIRNSDASVQVRRAATIGIIQTSSRERAREVLKQLLSSETDWEFEAGLQAALRTKRPMGTELLADTIAVTSPDRQQQLLAAIEARGDDVALPAVRRATSSDVAVVQKAAISALGSLGDASDVQVLVRFAQVGDASIQTAAREALGRIQDDDLDEVLIKMLASPDSPSRSLAVEIVGQRRITKAGPYLLRIAESADDAGLRLAALEALKRLADASLLPKMLDYVTSAKNREEREAAKEAVLAASLRVSDREQVIKLVDDRLAVWPSAERSLLFDVLQAVGGPEALELVAAAAQDSDRQLQDQATRVLGSWQTAAAAPVLLRVATSDHPYQVRALRGYLRIARQMNVDEHQRIEMSRHALEAATRDDERLLALEVLERVPTVQSLQLAQTQLAKDLLGSKASETVVSIAEKVAPNHPEAARTAAKQVLEAGGDTSILQRARQLAGT